MGDAFSVPFILSCIVTFLLSYQTVYTEFVLKIWERCRMSCSLHQTSGFLLRKTPLPAGSHMLLQHAILCASLIVSGINPCFEA